MRQRILVAGIAGMLVPASALLALVWAPASMAAVSVTGPWHSTEIRLPMDAAATPIAQFNAVACVTAKSCTGGGRYVTTSELFDAVIATKSNGSWGRAFILVMPQNFDVSHPDSAVTGVACPAAKSCVAVGTYLDSSATTQAFEAVQVRGSWHRAQEITDPASLATGGSASLDSVSCPSVGNCIAVGGFSSVSGFDSMAVREDGGRWRRAFAVRAPSGAAANPDALLSSVSCSGPEHCTAVGAYHDKAMDSEALAVTEINNRWPQSVRIAVPANASKNPDAVLFGVSCVASGACSAVGDYQTTAKADGAMAVMRGKHGWIRARQILPPKADKAVGLNTISCTGATSCQAGGFAQTGSGEPPAVVTESSGHWGRAFTIGLPGNSASGSERQATLLGIACFKRNACAAVGWYFDNSDNEQAMASSRSG
jgi:hypothetical protein